jgi:tetratricopeptide (TPR) repeat protein
MKLSLILISLLLVLNSCSCSKEKEDENLITFDSTWEKYHLLCNFNIANRARCNQLQAQLDQFGPEHVTEKTLQKLVQTCSNNQPSACVVLSWYFFRVKKYESSIKFGKKHCPKSSTACFYVGESYSLLGQLAESLPFLEKACVNGEAAGCERIGHFYLGEQKYKGAVKYFRKACDLEESFGCYNLACAYSLMNDVELSYNALEEAFQLGFEDWKTVISDKDLLNLKKGKNIPALIDSYK